MIKGQVGRVTGNCADLTSSNPGYRLHGPRESSQRRAPDARQDTLSPAYCAPAGQCQQLGHTTGHSSAQLVPARCPLGSAPQPAVELVTVPRPGT